MSGYHNFPEMVAEIKAAATAYPDIVQVFSIGKSYRGRDIWAAKVSDNVATDEAEPEVLIDALHHAREHLTIEQALDAPPLADDGYGSDSPDHEPRRHARDLHHLRAQPRRLRYDLDRRPVPGLAQEPPAERRLDRRRHRPQPQLRLPLGLLRRLVGQPGGDRPTAAPSAVLGARDAALPRLREEPGRSAASSRSGPTSPSTPTAS